MALAEVFLGHKNGLLRSDKRKNALLNLLGPELFQAENTHDTRAAKGICDVIQTLVRTGDPESVTMLLISVLSSAFYVPSPYSKEERLAGLFLLAPNESEDPVFNQREHFQKGVDFLVGRIGLREFNEGPRRGCLSKTSITDFKEFYTEFAEAIGEGPQYVDGQSVTVTQKLGISKEVQQSRMLTPAQAMMRVSGVLGSLYARLLQLAPMIYDLPPEYEELFIASFDEARDPIKFSDYLTLEREWPNFKSEVLEMGECLGVGSLRSAYRIQTTSGTEAVKVLRPNVKHLLEEELVLLTQLIESHAQNNPEFGRILPMLGVCAEWIAKDVSLKENFALQKRFGVNNGFSVSGNRYTMIVPQVLGEPNEYYIREQFIEGTNLTKPEELLNQGHNLGQILELVTASYQFQLRNGLVHSDVHPGNIRVSGNKVAWLDINYLLELPFQDLFKLRDLAKQGKRYQGLLSYLQYKGVAVPTATAKRLCEMTEPPGARDALLCASHCLMEGGVVPPLDVLLLSKNVLGLHYTAKYCGVAL